MAGSIIAAVHAILFSVMAATFGPSPGTIPAAAACVMASPVGGAAAGSTLRKLEDRVRAPEARREPSGPS